jgi:hypothetical protein
MEYDNKRLEWPVAQMMVREKDLAIIMAARIGRAVWQRKKN